MNEFSEKFDFLNAQPHPECKETRCTTDNGVPLKPAVNKPAITCCALTHNNICTLFLVPKNLPGFIESYRKDASGAFTFHSVVHRFDTGIKSINPLYANGLPLLFVLADKAYLLRLDGTIVDSFSMNAHFASAFWHENQIKFVCDGTLYRFDATHALIPCGEIHATPYRINANRYDYLAETGTTVPGNTGGLLFPYNDSFLFTCAQKFNRCARENVDTFLCIGTSLDTPFSRRYLLIPNGGAANLFIDEDGDLSAAFVGSTQYSCVFEKAAIIKLAWQPFGFWRPEDGLVFENSPVDSMQPADNGNIDIRDSFVYAAPDGWYYLTGTTARPHGTFWKNTNGICLWKTKDLTKWEYVGKVFDYQDMENSWQGNISTNCWAPEMCYYNDTYWITYSLEPGCGLLKSLSGKPEGPYCDMGRVVMRGIDSGFFVDDADNSLYLVWQNGRIARFTKDGTSFSEEPRLLLPSDGQQVGYEGAGIIKVEGKYVLYAAEWNGDTRIDGTYDMMYSVADSVYGPYSPRKLLAPHAGHGCLFYDHEGNLRFSMFGNDRTAPFSRKIAVGCVDVCWKNGELILSPKG